MSPPRRWLTSRLIHGPYWLWHLLYTISPYHRGYDHGYEQAVKNLLAGGRETT